MEHWAAAGYRLALRRVVFVGVTGSVGKTVTKDLIAAVLGARGPGRKTEDSRNGPHWVARNILATRRRDAFCVVEVGATGIGSLDRPIRLLRPGVAVITRVATDHWSSFHSLTAIAREKRKLVAALPASGVAVLNADDPHVLSMGAGCRGRVVTYGLAPAALVRAEEVRAAWPEPLAFTVHYAGQALPVATRLYGVHWVSSVLAALATGLALGIPLERAVGAVATVEPMVGRLSPVSDAHGVTFIRDDWKASLATVGPALELLRAARAPRKIAVIGTVSDYRAKGTDQWVRITEEALAVAHHVVLVGPSAVRGLRVRRTRPHAAVHAFGTVKGASDFLEGLLQPGDLVLLKGSTRDHVERIALRRTQRVVCWLTDCGQRGTCERCPRFTVPARAAAAELPPAGAEDLALEAADRLVVGFGNPGERYEDAPHNVGQRVLDRLASRFAAGWTPAGDVVLAHVVVGALRVYLAKPQTKVNLTGGAVKRLADRLGLRPADCILVHDDLDLPPGAVRTRLGGGAGGHNGVRSVIEAYQSQAIPRVKIGVGRPARKEDIPAYVLSAVPADQRAALDRAFDEAATRVLGLLEAPCA